MDGKKIIKIIVTIIGLLFILFAIMALLRNDSIAVIFSFLGFFIIVFSWFL